MSQPEHLDWPSSPGSLFLAAAFLCPQTKDQVLSVLDWSSLLGGEPEQQIERLLARGILEYSDQEQPLAERLARFKLPALREFARARGLPTSGRKQEVIARLLAADPEGMKREDGELRSLQCTAQGRKAIETHLTSAEAASRPTRSGWSVGFQQADVGAHPRPDNTQTRQALQHAQRGCQFGNRGQFKQAIAEFERAIKLDPTASWPIFWRGLARARQQNYAPALADFDKAVSLNPQRPEFYAGRGDVHRRQGKLQAAIEEYNKALARAPEFALAYHNRGVAYEAQGDYRRALADYDRAIELSPRAVEPHLGRGAAYERVGEFDAAADEYELVLTLTDDIELLRHARQRLQQVLLYL